MTAIITVIGLLLSCAIGLWKFFRGKANDKEKKVEVAEKTFQEGIDARDPSKITASNDDLNNMR